jgi:hypothetical protein
MGERRNMDNLVFVDLDETLIHTMMEPLALDTRIERYATQVTTAHAHGDTVTAKWANFKLHHAMRIKEIWEAACPFPEYDANARITVRPGAVEGLEGLYGLGDVILFTAARHDYAVAALERVGLSNLFQLVYSLQDDPDLSWAFSRPRVLLDDTPASEKLVALGVPPELQSLVLVSVQPYTGSGSQVEPLTHYVPQAHRRLLSLHAASI